MRGKGAWLSYGSSNVRKLLLPTAWNKELNNNVFIWYETYNLFV